MGAPGSCSGVRAVLGVVPELFRLFSELFVLFRLFCELFELIDDLFGLFGALRKFFEWFGLCCEVF